MLMPVYPILLPPLYRGGDRVVGDTVEMEETEAAPLQAIGVLGTPVSPTGEKPASTRKGKSEESAE